jgi:hypothetical protein
MFAALRNSVALPFAGLADLRRFAALPSNRGWLTAGSRLSNSAILSCRMGWSAAILITAADRGDGYRCAPPILRRHTFAISQRDPPEVLHFAAL